MFYRIPEKDFGQTSYSFIDKYFGSVRHSILSKNEFLLIEEKLFSERNKYFDKKTPMFAKH
jgi:hypothetical protein